MAEFGRLTIGASNYATNTVKSSDKPKIKKDTETVIYYQRGTHAGKQAYDSYNWCDGTAMA